jgi:hypothetical protein
MTPALSKAIDDTQRLLQMDNSDWSFLLDETEKRLSEMPGDDWERKIIEIRDSYLAVLRFESDMPEASQNMIALAFADKLRQRLKDKIQ